MNKMNPKTITKTIIGIKPYYIFFVLLVFIGISIFALRANNQHMGILREKVFAADQKGIGVEESLNNLRDYVNSHMNNSLSSGPNSVYPPIQLKYTYQRLASAEQAKTSNSNIYHDAQIYCQGQDSTSFYGRNRIPCIESYIQSHGLKSVVVPTGLYEFDFISPSWSPDIAGWSLVISSFLFCILAIDIGYWLRNKKNKKSK